VVLPAPQFLPEGAVLLGAGVLVFDENAVVFSFNFLEPIAHYLQEVVIGRTDRPVRLKFDYRLRAVNRLDEGGGLGVGFASGRV